MLNVPLVKDPEGVSEMAKNKDPKDSDESDIMPEPVPGERSALPPCWLRNRPSTLVSAARMTAGPNGRMQAAGRRA